MADEEPSIPSLTAFLFARRAARPEVREEPKRESFAERVSGVVEQAERRLRSRRNWVPCVMKIKDCGSS